MSWHPRLSRSELVLKPFTSEKLHCILLKLHITVLRFFYSLAFEAAIAKAPRRVRGDQFIDDPSETWFVTV